MVISEDREFIFIRVPKTASTSVAAFLIKNLCSDDDVYTGIGDAAIQSSTKAKLIEHKYKHQSKFVHLTLQECFDNNLITATQINHFRIIGVIRHPLDRQLSLFFYECQKPQSRYLGYNVDPTPQNFRKMMVNGFFESYDVDQYHYVNTPQSNFFKVNGLSYYENLWPYDMVSKLSLKFCKYFIGDDLDYLLPTFKNSFRNKHSFIDDFYDDHTKAAVLDYFAEDLHVYNDLMEIYGIHHNQRLLRQRY